MFTYLKSRFQDVKTLNFDCFDKDGFTIWKLLIFLAHGFANKDLTAKAASLTYYSFTSIVPFMSLFFCFTPRFGAEDMVPYLQTIFPYFSDVIASAFVLISRYGQEAVAMTPWVHLVTVGVMVWCGYNLCYNVVHNLNVVWEVEDRPFWERLKFYVVAFVGLAIMISVVAPFVSQLPRVFGVNVAVYILLCMVITSMYFFGPNTKVSFLAALVAALIFVGLLILMNVFFFWLYDVLVSSYVRNYGKTFFIVFMLFAWFETIWIFFLIGSMVSCLLDKHSRYTLLNKQARLSSSYKDYLKILVACVFYKRWLSKGDCITQEEIECHELIRDNLNYSLLREVLNDLQKKEIVKLCRPKVWIGIPQIETVGDIMLRLDVMGEYSLKSDCSECQFPGKLWKQYQTQLIGFYKPFVEESLKDLDIESKNTSSHLPSSNDIIQQYCNQYGVDHCVVPLQSSCLDTPSEQPIYIRCWDLAKGFFKR